MSSNWKILAAIDFSHSTEADLEYADSLATALRATIAPQVGAASRMLPNESIAAITPMRSTSLSRGTALSYGFCAASAKKSTVRPAPQAPTRSENREARRSFKDMTLRNEGQRRHHRPL